MTSRRLVALVVLPLVGCLAACGSSDSVSGSPTRSMSTQGSGSSAPTSPTSSSLSSSSGGAASSGAPSTGTGSTGGSDGGGTAEAVELVATIKAATARIRTATFTSETALGSLRLTGSGAQKLDNGVLQDLEITQKLPTGEQRIVIVGGKTYVKQPGLSKNAAKPYVLLSTTSSNPLVRQLATQLGAVRSSASLNSAVGFLSAAKSVTKLGGATVAGQRTTHYRLVADPSKLPADVPNSADIKKAGLSDVPIDLYLDSVGRPVETLTTVSVQGRTITSRFLITKFDGPVSITAPPSSQVTTG